jgi:hypothetical protein
VGMTRGAYNKVSIDDHLDMTIWTFVALPVMPQNPSLFGPDFAATGAHKDPVHSQAGKWLVLIQQAFK